MTKIHSALAILVLGFGAASVSAQNAPAVKVDGGKMEVKPIPTPQFAANNVPDKRWRPKEWMEVDVPFQIRLPASEGGRKGTLDTLMINYYIGLNAQTKDGKFEVIKGSFNYVDIPSAEECHTLTYVAPGTLRRLLNKDGFTPSDVKAWGYEILVNGSRVGGESSVGNAWWEKTENFSINDGVMLAKKDTPFSILWGDYDVSVRKQ